LLFSVFLNAISQLLSSQVIERVERTSEQRKHTSIMASPHPSVESQPLSLSRICREKRRLEMR
jgi:hypothetical protein